MAELQTIEEMWTHLEGCIFDDVANVPAVQLREMKRAFVAGCDAMFTMSLVLFAGDAPKNQVMAYLAATEKYLADFKQAVMDGKA